MVVDLLHDLPGPLLVPTPVLTEAEYLIAKLVGDRAARALLVDVASGAFTHSVLQDSDLERAIAVMDSHPGLRLGLADATVVAQAERLKIVTILTMEHRDFRRVRPSHVRAFELVPSEADLARARPKRKR